MDEFDEFVQNSYFIYGLKSQTILRDLYLVLKSFQTKKKRKFQPKTTIPILKNFALNFKDSKLLHLLLSQTRKMRLI